MDISEGGLRKVITTRPYSMGQGRITIPAKNITQINPETDKRGKIVSIGLIQTAVSDNLEENIVKTRQKIEEASKRGAKIICLQELYRTKYFPQKEKEKVSELAETIPGESTKVFSEIAKKNKIVLIVPLFEKHSNGKHYNTAVVIDASGEILGAYRKVHIPNDPLFYEKNYFVRIGLFMYCFLFFR